MDDRQLRRSTRIRSTSVEVEPLKTKSSSRTKKALPSVQESPAKRSSGAFSGTTAQNSILLAKGADDATAKLVDGLGELWETSGQLLNKVLVEPLTRDANTQLVSKLQTSVRFQKDVLHHITKLKDAMSKYPGLPINVTTTNLHIFGLQNAKEFREGLHRPDNILYRANLAYAVGVLVEKIIEGMDDFDSDDMLRLFFGTFSRVIKSNEKVTSGSTSCLKATFGLALELQIKAFFQTVEDAVADGEDDFDASKALVESFYKGSSLRGWDIPGLQYKDLSQSQRNVIIDRVKQIHSRLDKGQDLQDLQEASSDASLIFRCFFWARERNVELLQRMEAIPDGPLGTQDAIDAEIARAKSMQDDDTIHVRSTTAKPVFFHPSKPSTATASKKGKAPVSTRIQPQTSRQQSSEVASAVTAPAYQHELDMAFVEENESFEPALFVGDEGFAGDDDNVPKEIAPYNPTEEETRQLSQHIAWKTRQANKENLPRRAPKEIPRSQPRPAIRKSDKGKGKRRYDEMNSDEDEDGDETDISQDGDSAFVTQRTPERVNRQRRLNTMPSKAGPSQRPIRSVAGRDGGAESRIGSQEGISNTQRTDLYNAVNQEAKERMAELKLRNLPKQRIPWSVEEIEYLLEQIEEYSTRWARIKATDTNNILHHRDQVALKDKARNMKLDFLKANKPLPPNFNLVPLKNADKKKLEEMGIYDIQ